MLSGGLLPDTLKGTRTEEIVHVTDIYKTICTQSGSNCNDLSLDGRDLTDLIQGNGVYSSQGRSIIINVNNWQCNGVYNGNPLCGAIIKHTTNGVYKAMIGDGISGTTSAY